MPEAAAGELSVAAGMGPPLPQSVASTRRGVILRGAK